MKTAKTVCKIISIILVIAFAVTSVLDYIRYDPRFTSAPFSVCLLINAVCLLVPALFLYLIGIFLGKKQ